MSKEQLGLFKTGEGKNISNILPIPDEWAELLDNNIIEATKRVFDKTNKERVGKTIYPRKTVVFKAFELLPQDVRVVILGQDPYHNGNANGRAFACKKTLSPSLAEMFGAINRRTYLKDMNAKKSLEHWQEQGVLLLNTCLTVEKAKPLSHSSMGWNRFIIPILQNFSREYKGIIYMLWGNSARSLKRHIEKEGNTLLEFTHPAFAARTGGQWQCNHFQMANAYFKQNNRQTINWN